MYRCTGVTGNDLGSNPLAFENPPDICENGGVSCMSGTFLESSWIDCTGERLDSCVSEMMNGLDPASKTLWIFPESVGVRHTHRAVIIPRHNVALFFFFWSPLFTTKDHKQQGNQEGKLKIIS